MMQRASPPTSAGGATLTVSIQPLVQRPHHLGAAKALEAIPHVVVVPAGSADLHDPADGQPVTAITHLDRRSSAHRLQPPPVGGVREATLTC